MNDTMPKKIGSWTELQKTEVYNNLWIRVTESKVLNPNGGEGIYGVVDFHNWAIGIIPLDEDNNTWIVGQERYPFDGEYSWEIPEGGGSKDVDLVESAQRELMEEVGIEANRFELLLEMDLSNSATTEKAYIFVARELSYHQSNPEETEQLEVKKLPFEELYEMVMEGKIKDSLTVAGVLKLKYLLKNKAPLY